MIKNPKKLIITTFLLSLVLIGSYALYRVYLRPEALRIRLSDALSEKIHKKVTITGISIDTWSRPVVFLKDFELGDQDGIYLKCPSVRVRISAWHLLRGKVKPRSITLQNPLIIIHPDKLTQQKNDFDFPLLRTSGAQLKLVFQNHTLEFDELEGTISPSRINLDARMLKGNINITALKIGKTWNGGAILSDLNLRDSMHKTAGEADLKIFFHSDLSEYSAVVTAHGKNLQLPWGSYVKKAGLSMLVTGNSNSVTFSRIDFDNPVFSLKGTATCSQLATASPVICELNLESNAFSYDDFVRLLPVQQFKKNIRSLLTSDIRGGVFQATSILYAGKLTEMNNFSTCLHNLYIKGRLSGQSYAAIPGLKRVQNISGIALANRGTIEFREITGTMGKSMIREVTLIFPKVADQGFKTDIAVDINMATDDFLDTWRASVTQHQITALLDPVSRVTGGKISGQASLHYDDQKGESFIKGELELRDAGFFWGGKKIEHANVTGIAGNYQAPLLINGSLVLDGMPIDIIDFNLKDPFGKKNFTYTLQARNVLSSPNFSLNKDASYKLSGEGEWPRYNGKLNIATQDLTLFGHNIRPAKGGINAEGNFTGAIAEDSNIQDLLVSFESSRLSANVSLGQNKKTYQFSGAINLADINSSNKDGVKVLDGHLDGNITIVHEKQTNMRGNLNLDNTRVLIGGKPTSLKGSLNFLGDNITAPSLEITRENMHTLAKGSLRLGAQPFFNGEISVDGLTLQNTGKSDELQKRLKKCDGKAKITFTNLNYNGLEISSGTTDAALSRGILSLKNIQMNSSYGTVNGLLLIPSDQKNTFDLNVVLKDMPIENFLQAFSSEPVWIEGTMDLQGRIWGKSDNLNGNLNLKAAKGRILRYSLMSRLFSVLNPYKMIKSREIDLRSKGFSYNTMTADLTISNSEVRYDNFYLDSNSLQLSALGTYQINNHYIDAIVGIQPLETMDKTLGMIPVVGWVLTGEKGTLLVLSMQVRGPLDDTSVKLLPANTLSKPVAQSLLRILKLPVDLVTKPAAVILPGMQKKEEEKKEPEELSH